MKRTKLKDKEVNPFKTILFGFLGYVIIGVALISLPFAQKIPVGFVDNLFNVVSAMSTTGLTTGSLSDMYTPFGKIILLGLIQLGAIGYMTLTSFLILSTSKKISTHRVKILSAEFSMPENFLHFRVSETEIQAVRKCMHCPEFQAEGKEKSPESLGITGVQDFSFWF